MSEKNRSARFPIYAILTAENNSIDGFTSTLQGGKYPFRRVKECSVVIGGICLSSVKHIADFYGLQSFVFIRREKDSEVVCEMWAKGFAGKFNKVDGRNENNFVTVFEIDVDINAAMDYLDAFLEICVVGKGNYGKLFEGLGGGPKTARYYWQCRCTGMAGAKYDPDGVVMD